MRIRHLSNGYGLWLSANDTYYWAHKPGASWPCSDLADHRVYVGVDSNGLCDFAIDGEPGDCDGNELEAIVSDHLPEDLKKYWPCWK